MSYSRALIQTCFALILTGLAAQAPAPNTTPTDQKKPSTQQEPTPEAGGPQGETGPIVVPKKKEDEAPKQEPKPPKVKNPAGLEDYSIRISSQLVTVPVSVVTKDGQFIPNLKAENFRVLEDGVEQKVNKLEQTEAPITVVMLLEFSNPNFYINKQIFGTFMYDM